MTTEQRTKELAPPALPALTQPSAPVVAVQSDFFILADDRIQAGLAWHVYNAFSALLTDAWFDVLRQYGVESAAYGGFQSVRLPDNLSYDNQEQVCRPFYAPGRLVLALPFGAAGVQGWLTDGWAAYHSWRGDSCFAIVPCGDWPTWAKVGGSPFGHPDTELIAASHEWAEYMTDPTGQGVRTPQGEIGDDCNWQPHSISASGWHYRVTKLYDASAGGICRP